MEEDSNTGSDLSLRLGSLAFTEMKLFLFLLLSALVFSIGNSENQPQRRSLKDEVSEAVGVERLPIADLLAHSRQERQAMCNNQTDCIPSSLSGEPIPTDLVDCDSGFCVCRQCFELDGDRCRELAPCQTYSRSTRRCDDARRDQLVALLLSIFLSEVGAANFYIARNDLAGGQLAIFLMSFVVIIVATCPCCFMCCCKDESGERTVVAFTAYIIAIVVGVVIALICSLMILAWWIADLVIFIQNSRLDGQNCMLRSFSES